MKVLFICNMNKHRSPTAEELFRNRFETKSAGLYGGRLVSKKELSWADMIVVMEPEQRIELVKRFPNECMQKRVICLDVPDVFQYKDPELVEILERKAELL